MRMEIIPFYIVLAAIRRHILMKEPVSVELRRGADRSSKRMKMSSGGKGRCPMRKMSQELGANAVGRPEPWAS
jgi:hypothetical protein